MQTAPKLPAKCLTFPKCGQGLNRTLPQNKLVKRIPRTSGRHQWTSWPCHPCQHACSSSAIIHALCRPPSCIIAWSVPATPILHHIEHAIPIMNITAGDKITWDCTSPALPSASLRSCLPLDSVYVDGSLRPMRVFPDLDHAWVQGQSCGLDWPGTNPSRDGIPIMAKLPYPLHIHGLLAGTFEGRNLGLPSPMLKDWGCPYGTAWV